MSAGAVLLAAVVQDAGGETYGDLLRSGPHWLFELTLEVVTAPVAFALGWLWRSQVLRHVHRDLREHRSHAVTARTRPLHRAVGHGPPEARVVGCDLGVRPRRPRRVEDRSVPMTYGGTDGRTPAVSVRP